MKPYHKVWITHNGPIPKDNSGRSMEIHHIDGDHTNNDINNLRLVTIDEHYKIHYQQKDWGACYFMMMRMNKTPEEISNECSELQRKLVAEGSHHLLSGEIQRKYQCHLVSEGKHIFQQRSDGSSASGDRVKNGTHHFLRSSDGTSVSSERVSDGTHNFLGPESNAKRISDGTHHLLGSSSNRAMLASGKHPSQKQWTCEHCGITGMGGGNYKRYHGDKCKNKNENSGTIDNVYLDTVIGDSRHNH
jgi:hypothetical protein